MSGMERNLRRQPIVISFVRALDSKSFVLTQTKRLNFLFKVLFLNIRQVGGASDSATKPTGGLGSCY